MLYATGSSLNLAIANLQSAFDTFQISLIKLMLVLNSGKTKCMLFSRSPKSIQPTAHIQTLQRSEIEIVECYKYFRLLRLMWNTYQAN